MAAARVTKVKLMIAVFRYTCKPKEKADLEGPLKGASILSILCTLVKKLSTDALSSFLLMPFQEQLCLATPAAYEAKGTYQ